MGILFAISIAALLALLWAAFQTARHVRRARQRQRNAVKAAAEARNEVVQQARFEAIRSSTDAKEPAQATATEEASLGSTAAERDWSQVRYNPTGIIGNSFTGTSPKI